LIADILKIIAKGAFYLIRIIFQVTLVVLAVYFMSGIISGNPQEQEGMEGIDRLEGRLPMFYLSVLPKWYDYRLELIPSGLVKKQGVHFLRQGMNFDDWKTFQNTIKNLSSKQEYREWNSWRYNLDRLDLQQQLSVVIATEHYNPIEIQKLKLLRQLVQFEDSRRLNRWIPTIHWWGSNNAFHQEAKTFFFNDGKMQQIRSAGYLSFVLSIIAFCFSVIGGTALALLYMRMGSKWQGVCMVVLNIFYVFPIFCLAVLAVQFCTSDYYSDFLHIFPGPGDFLLMPSTSFIDVLEHVAFFILPALLLSIPLIAGIAMRWIAGMEDEMKKPYVQTLYSKGIDLYTLQWKHLLKNVSLPMITYFAMLFPALMSGVLLIENVFSIGGMGRLIWQSVRHEDFIMLMVITALVALINAIMGGIGQMVKQMFDPRTEIMWK